ncbi:MAG: hypothetical protein QNJ22_14795 [Desulfosarcinaceae bacterium]|nr:hypothetical protein [Desulfosarcinaceae bacterium]
MGQNKSLLLFVPLFLLAIVLQVALILVDGKQTATGTAVAFSKAYFMADPAMADLVCAEVLGEEDETSVELHIHQVALEAQRRGVPVGYIRHQLEHVHTETIHQDETSAEIHLSAKKRVSINPVFAYVAKLFSIGETQKVETVLHLIKEEGQWKVCGSPYELGI